MNYGNARLFTILNQLNINTDALNDRVAVITGAGRGIGEYVALGLAHFGSKVIIVDVLERGGSVAHEIREKGGSAEFYLVDLSSIEDVAHFPNDLLRDVGSIDILVNNASKLDPGSVQQIPISSWDELFRIVVRSSAYLISSFLPGMLQRGRGVIANTIAVEGLSYGAHFSAAMVGNRSLVLSLAGELAANSGVRVFGFAPGLTETQLALDYISGAAKAQGITSDEWIARFVHNPGYDGFMPVEDCAAAYVYCLSHADAFHGQIADAFQPLGQADVIDLQAHVRHSETDSAAGLADTVDQIGEYVSGVASLNRNLEIRIAERTKELQTANEQLAIQKRETERLSTAISRYLPEQIYESIFKGEIEQGVSSRRKHLTVFFSDICDFAATAERLEPEPLSEVINTYFSAMTKIARDHGATIDKFIGDAILAFFGDPHSEDPGKDAEKCVQMAIDMQQRMRGLNDTFDRLGLHEPLSIRIGINSGFCTVGNFGSFDRMDYTIVGRPVNVAARLQSACPPDSVYISRNTQALLAGRFELVPVGALSLKGIREGVDAYQVKFDYSPAGDDKGSGPRELSELQKHLEALELGLLDEDKKQEILSMLSTVLKSPVNK